MEKKDQQKKKQKSDKHHKGGPTEATPNLEALHGTGANLFGYLSQAYGAESKQTGNISGIYENEEVMVQLQCMDPNLKLIFKKLQKKDGETKMKGMVENINISRDSDFSSGRPLI